MAKLTCPNPKHPEFQKLVKEFGEFRAYKGYFMYPIDDEFPSAEWVKRNVPSTTNKFEGFIPISIKMANGIYEPHFIHKYKYDGRVVSQIYPMTEDNVMEVMGYSDPVKAEAEITAMKEDLSAVVDFTEIDNYRNEMERKYEKAHSKFFSGKSELSIMQVFDNYLQHGDKTQEGFLLLKHLLENNLLDRNIRVSNSLFVNGVLGKYDLATHEISMDLRSQSTYRDSTMSEVFISTLAHEAVHAHTYDRLLLYDKFKTWENAKAYMSKEEFDAAVHLNSLYERTKAVWDKRKKDHKIYGLGDVYEFVAEAMSNSNFREQLDVVSKEVITDGDKSLLDQIFDAIAHMLNSLRFGNHSDLVHLVTGLSNKLIELNDPVELARNSAILKDYKKVALEGMKFNSITDIPKSLKKIGSHYQYSEDDLKRNMFNQVTDASNSEMTLTMFGGQVFNFKGLTDEQIKSKIESDIITRITDFEKNVVNNLTNWVNSGADPESFSKHFKTEYKDQYSDINKEIASTLLTEHMEYEFNDKAYRLDSPEIKAMGINIPAFVGNNPMVTVHNDTEGGKPVISMFDITNIPLSEYTTKSVFDFFEKNLGITIGNKFKANEMGIRRLQLTLSAMAIKNANPNVVIRKVGILQMAAKEEKLDSHYINLQDSVLDVKEILSKPGAKKLFSDEILDVISKPELLDPQKYDISYLWWFHHWAKAKAQRPGKGIEVGEEQFYSEQQKVTMPRAYDRIAARVMNYLQDKTSSEDILEFMIDRQKYIEQVKYKNHKTDKEQQAKLEADPEYVLINNSILQLTAKSKRGLTRIKDLSKFSNYMKSQQNVSNPFVQQAMYALQEGLMRTRTAFMEWNKGMIDHWKNVEKVFFEKNPEARLNTHVVDYSSERFKRIWKTESIPDATGKMITMPLDEIHWNKDDAATQAAKQAGTITDSDIAFGKAIVDSYEKMLIKYLTHERMLSTDGVMVMTEEQKADFAKDAKRIAEETVAKKYKKGRVLVLEKSAKEHIFSGNFKQGYNVAIDNLMNPENYYSQTKNTNGDVLSSTSATKYYVNQLLNNDDYGQDRLSKFGLESTDKSQKKVVVDEKRHENNTLDLELGTKLMIASIEKTIQTEQYILPMANAAISALHAYEHSDGTAMENSKEYILRRYKMLVSGQTQIDELKKYHLPVPFINRDVSVGEAVMTLNQFGVASNLALSMGSGVTASFTNSMAVTNNAISNIGSEYLAGPKETAIAAQKFMFDHRKVINILYKNQLVDMDTNDLIHGKRKGIHTEFTKDVWNSHVFQWFNWAPDFTARATVTIAQMIKDGTYEAFDENGDYHEELDPRYKKEDGALFKDYRRTELIQSGHMTTEDKKLTRAYTDKEVFAIRDQSSQEIVGGYMSDEGSNSGFKLVGRLFDTYKTWLKNKISGFWSEGYERDVSGRLVNDSGAVTWEKEYYEGKIQSLAAVARILKENYHSPLSAWTEVGNLKDRQKKNLKRLTLDVLMASVLTVMLRGAFDDDDEIDPKTGKKRPFTGKSIVMGKYTNATGITKSMVYAIQDLTNEWRPTALIDLVQEPFAIMGQAKKLAALSEALVTFDTDDAVNDAWRLMPFTNTVTYATGWTPKKEFAEMAKAEKKITQ